MQKRYNLSEKLCFFLASILGCFQKMIRMKNDIQLEVRTTIDATIEDVWEGLTDPALIKQYFFGTDTYTDWQPGSPIRFTGEWQGKTYADKGTIMEVKPYKLIRYDYWSSMSGIEDRPENYIVVTYELSGKDGAVELLVRQQNIPDEKTKIHSEENWKKVIAGLKELVEEKTISKARS